MKRAMGMLLIVMLLLNIPTLACAGESSKSVRQVTALTAGETYSADLDGDGAEESICWELLTSNDEDFFVSLVVMSASGLKTWQSDEMWGVSGYLCDLDNDGVMEIFFSGGIWAGDYATYCLHFDGSAFSLLSFPETRSDGTGTNTYVLAEITDISSGEVTVGNYEDALGTYYGTRTLVLSDGAFAWSDDGLWIFERDFEEDGFWDSGYVLTVKRALTVTMTDGSILGLAVGERLAITASDCSTIAYFQTEDGRTGSVPISANEEKGWGFLIDGVDEDEWFESVPYYG